MHSTTRARYAQRLSPESSSTVAARSTSFTGYFVPFAVQAFPHRQFCSHSARDRRSRYAALRSSTQAGQFRFAECRAGERRARSGLPQSKAAFDRIDTTRTRLTAKEEPMISGSNSARIWIGLVVISVSAIACQSDMTAPSKLQPIASAAKNSNGAAGQTPAFYDGELFTVNM